MVLNITNGTIKHIWIQASQLETSWLLYWIIFFSSLQCNYIFEYFLLLWKLVIKKYPYVFFGHFFLDCTRKYICLLFSNKNLTLIVLPASGGEIVCSCGERVHSRGGTVQTLGLPESNCFGTKWGKNYFGVIKKRFFGTNKRGYFWMNNLHNIF